VVYEWAPRWIRGEYLKSAMAGSNVVLIDGVVRRPSRRFNPSMRPTRAKGARD